MSRLRITVVMLILLVGLAAAGPAAGAAITVPPGGSFFDDDGNIFESDIEALAAKGVTKGCNNEKTSFCPNRSVTRGQMAAFLVRALGLTAQDPDIDFADDNESIFEDDIEKLATAGITKGCNKAQTIFCPNRPVTRGEMAAFLVRALDLTAQNPAIDFTDDDGSVFEDDIEKLATAGITKGCGTANTFCPLSNVTRGQMAAFLTRGLEYERPAVAPRPETTNGPVLDTASPYDKDTGYCDASDGEVCLTSEALNQGEFYLFEYWFANNWSSLPTSVKNDFLSNKIRVEAFLNGGQLSLVEVTVLEDDTMFKDYTFQFPDWLTGTHQVEVNYFNDTENYESTIIVTMSITALSSTSQAPSAPAELARPGGRLGFESK